MEVPNFGSAGRPIEAEYTDDLGEYRDQAPTGERLVCRNQDAASLVALGDQRKQHAGFGLFLSDIRQFI